MTSELILLINSFLLIQTESTAFSITNCPLGVSVVFGVFLVAFRSISVALKDFIVYEAADLVEVRWKAGSPDQSLDRSCCCFQLNKHLQFEFISTIPTVAV